MVDFAAKLRESRGEPALKKRFRIIGEPAPLAGVRILITGSRYWTNVEKVYTVLEHAKERFGDNIIVVEGDAKGADKISGKCAKALALGLEVYPADWETYNQSCSGSYSQSAYA